MNCEEFWNSVTASDLVLANRASGNQHLQECEQCRLLFASLTQGLEAVRQEVRKEEPEFFWQQMCNTIDTRVGPPVSLLHRLRTWCIPAGTWRPALAAAALLVAVMVLFFRMPGKPLVLPEEDISLLVGTPRLSAYEEPLAAELDQSTANDQATDPLHLLFDFNEVILDAEENTI